MPDELGLKKSFWDKKDVKSDPLTFEDLEIFLNSMKNRELERQNRIRRNAKYINSLKRIGEWTDEDEMIFAGISDMWLRGGVILGSKEFIDALSKWFYEHFEETEGYIPFPARNGYHLEKEKK